MSRVNKKFAATFFFVVCLSSCLGQIPTTITNQRVDSIEQVPDRYPTCKGSTLISGLASFTVTNVTGNSFTLALAPSAVRFLASGVGVGADMGFSIQSLDNTTTMSYSIGPKFLLTMGEIENSVIPYFGIGVDYMHLTETSPSFGNSGSTTRTDSKNGSVAKIGFGVMIDIGESLVLPIEIDILATSVESKKNTIYSFGVGLAGFLY